MFNSTWYRSRGADSLCAAALISAAERGDIAAALITGAPGVGKTSFAQALAESWGAQSMYMLAHHWVSDEDLFTRVDPARVAALAGGHDIQMQDAYQPGALLRAARASESGRVVLTLDEWDKAPQRADALLLDFLQTGIVRGPFGESWQARQNNLIVVITSNGLREISEPLLRRCYRYRMEYLAPNVESDVIRKSTGAPPGVCRAIVDALGKIRAAGESSPSLSEAVALARDLRLASSVAECAVLCVARLAKTQSEEAIVKSLATIIWGEWRRAQR